MHFNLIEFIQTIGYVGIAGIIFAETGVFFLAFLLPGDSLLFTAGFLASQNYLNIMLLMLVCGGAAILGDSLGYALGRRFGPKIFSREDSFFFNKSHVVRAHAFFEKYGGKTLILARFIPGIRGIVPTIAGIGAMTYGKFLSYNIVGALMWASGIPLLGYSLGNLIPDVDKYLLPIILGIVVVSVLPSGIHLLRDRSARKKIREMLHFPSRR